MTRVRRWNAWKRFALYRLGLYTMRERLLPTRATGLSHKLNAYAALSAAYTSEVVGNQDSQQLRIEVNASELFASDWQEARKAQTTWLMRPPANKFACLDQWLILTKVSWSPGSDEP